MHSSTTSYVALQNLYRAQFNSDFARFKQIVAETLGRIGLPADAIPADEIESFARNSGGVQVIKGRALKESKEMRGLVAEVYSKFVDGIANVDEQFVDEEKPIHLGLHLALLAAERFHLVTGRWPGSPEADDLAEENRQVEEMALSLLQSVVPGAEGGPETSEAIAEV